MQFLFSCILKLKLDCYYFCYSRNFYIQYCHKTYVNIIQSSLEVKAASLRIVVSVSLGNQSRMLDNRRMVSPRRSRKINAPIDGVESRQESEAHSQGTGSGNGLKINIKLNMHKIFWHIYQYTPAWCKWLRIWSARFLHREPIRYSCCKNRRCRL